MARWHIRIAIGVAVLVVSLIIAGLMYEINQDYKSKKKEQQWDIEFRKHYYDDTTIECERIFRKTGYWPKYCA